METGDHETLKVISGSDNYHEELRFQRRRYLDYHHNDLTKTSIETSQFEVCQENLGDINGTVCLAGANLERHLKTFPIGSFIPIDFDTQVIRHYRSIWKELPLIMRARIPFVIYGEFFSTIMHNSKLLDNVSIVDYDGCGGLQWYRYPILKSFLMMLKERSKKTGPVIFRSTWCASRACEKRPDKYIEEVSKQTNGVLLTLNNKNISRTGFYVSKTLHMHTSQILYT